jgi:hypothetical protein
MTERKLGVSESRSRWLAVAVSCVILAAVAVAMYFFSSRHVAISKVEKVVVFAPHTVMQETGGGMHVVGAAPASEDDLYIVATINVTDKMRTPLVLDVPQAVMTLSSGAELNAEVIGTHDLPRLEAVFPELKALAGNEIADGDEVQPEQTLRGRVVLLFPLLDGNAWKAKKSATLTLNIRNEAAQKLALP